MCPIYEVVSSEDPTRGRYVLALRDIKAGEIVVKDEPFVVVPSMKSLPVCIQCFKSYAMKEIPKCDSCGFPLCEEKEECDSLKLIDHKKEECEVLSKIGAKPIFVNNTISPLYMAIGPLRLLLKSRKDPESYKKHIKSLMGHVDASRNTDTKSCMMNQVIVVGFIQKTLGLSDFSAQQIHEVIGIIKTNSVKLDSKKGHLVGMAIYPDYSLFNHSCVANTKTRKKADGTLELFAISDIAKGKEIFTRYVTPQLGTFRRQQLLQANWHFACSCQRCSDPTEFETHLNSMKCKNCPGYMISNNPLDLNSSWSCLECQSVEKSQTIFGLILEFNIIFQKCIKNKFKLEELLSCKIAKYFHPNHFLLIGIMEQLVQIAMAEEKLVTDILKKKKIYDMKLKYFKKITSVMEVIDVPGYLWTQSLQKMINEEKKLYT